MLRRWLALAALAALAVLLAPRSARADQPGGHTLQVAVLGFDSDDADDQADALTGAVRSKVRGASGWSLIETTHSLGMLTAGLKCAARPNVECQQRIAEQLKAERFIWGVVSKGPTLGHVTAEVHLYQKGRPDAAVKETFSDNLKDPNDDKGIGKIGARVVERLSATTLGAIVVRAAPDAQPGEIILDGEKRVPLAHGTARLEAAPGGHSVEVSTPGAPVVKRNVLVTAGRESIVEIGAAPPGQGGVPEQPSKPFPTRKVLAGTAMGAGVVLGVISVVSLTAYLGDKSDGERLQPFIKKDETPSEACHGSTPEERDFCHLDSMAKRNSAVAWLTGTVGVAALGVGAFLFFTDAPADKASAKYKTRVTPTLGSSSGVCVTGSF